MGSIYGSVIVSTLVSLEPYGSDLSDFHATAVRIVLFAVLLLPVCCTEYLTVALILMIRRRRATEKAIHSDQRFFFPFVAIFSFPSFQFVSCKVVTLWNDKHYIGRLAAWHFLPEWLIAVVLIVLAGNGIKRLGEERIHWIIGGFFNIVLLWTTTGGADFIDRQLTQSWSEPSISLVVAVLLVAIFIPAIGVAMTFDPFPINKRRSILRRNRQALGSLADLPANADAGLEQ